MVDYSKFTIKEHMALEKQEYKYLDTINILDLISGKYLNIHDLMDTIELKYNRDYLLKTEIEDESIFNEISKEDFLDYLKERYKDKIWINEETTYYIITKNEK